MISGKKLISGKTKSKAVSRIARSKAAQKAAKGAGRLAFKGGKGEARLISRAMRPQGSREQGNFRYLMYGFFGLAGFAAGALLRRTKSSSDEAPSEPSSSAGGTGHHAPDPGSPAGERGRTWGTGTPVGEAGGGAGGQYQRPEDPNRTGAGREYSDPSTGPLVGQQHRGGIADVPEQQEEVEQRIRTGIGEDPRTMNLERVNVEVNDGVAELRGKAPSPESREAASEIAARAEGVREVRNLLQVNGHR